MKVSHITLASLVAFGLAGCGHDAPPSHSLAYYERHSTDASKVVDYCARHAREFHDHRQRYIQQVHNCDAAGNAVLRYYEKHLAAASKVSDSCAKRASEFRNHRARYIGQIANCTIAQNAVFNRKFWGIGAPRKQPVVVTSGGTLSTLTKALGGN